MSGGYEVFTNDPPTEGRALDLALNVSVAIPFSDSHVTPQLHAAYVTRDEEGVPDATFSDSFIAGAGVHVGNTSFTFAALRAARALSRGMRR